MNHLACIHAFQMFEAHPTLRNVGQYLGRKKNVEENEIGY